jgi:transposase InsO family protein
MIIIYLGGLLDFFAFSYFKVWPGQLSDVFHQLIWRRTKINNYNHAYRLVFEHIEAFYNTVRIHSHCGYLSPDQYETVYKKELADTQKRVS